MKKLVILTVLALWTFASFTCLAQTSEKEYIISMDHPLTAEVMKEFIQGCRYYHVEYKSDLGDLKAIQLVKDDPAFMGQITESHIYINEELTEYKYLFRMVLLNKLGEFFGLKVDDYPISNMMTNRIKINQRNEDRAEFLAVRPYQRRQFFEALYEERPRIKQL